MSTFIYFVAISGLGWLCDFGTYTLLVKLADAPNFVANFISSYVGVTFVWFTSLKTVFQREGTSRKLLFYWLYQFCSILIYSKALQLVVISISHMESPSFIADHLDVLGKCFITPFNLLTNFIFMRFLTRKMHEAVQ